MVVATAADDEQLAVACGGLETISVKDNFGGGKPDKNSCNGGEAPSSSPVSASSPLADRAGGGGASSKSPSGSGRGFGSAAAAGGVSLLFSLKKSNSLKRRSITLPARKLLKKQRKKDETAEASASSSSSSNTNRSTCNNMKEGVHFDEFRAPVASADASPVDSSGPDDDDHQDQGQKAASNNNKVGLIKANSMRNFFNRVVNQMSVATLTRRHSRRSATLTRRGGSKGGEADKSEERIAAWKKRFAEKVPGVIGIRNHGNTCFINAILQCLSYTDILAEYFVLDAYKSDLKRKKRLQTLTALNKGLGRGVPAGAAGGGVSKGEVTEQLAVLFKSLWSLQYDPEISIRFKSLVDKHASQYKGGRQHDAQEFLLWLLDQVHEELNMASRRRQRLGGKAAASTTTPTAPTQQQSDEAQAADALANYMRCNNSFVVDVFQAQFRSSLTCPECERQSNTFDPFLCVSLPIPQKQLMGVYVTVLYIDQSPRQVKLGLTIGVNETIGDLRAVLAKDTGIAQSQLLLTEIDALTFRKTFRDSQPVTCLKGLFTVNNDVVKKTTAGAGGASAMTAGASSVVSTTLYCIEVPRQREDSEDDGAFTVLTWVNVLKEGPIEKRFGSPYTIQVSRETLYGDLQKLLMKEMSSILHDDILISAQKVPLFKIRVVDGGVFDDGNTDQHTYLDSSVDLPMYTLAIEQAVNFCTVSCGKDATDGSPVHVKLVLEWDAPAKSQVIADDRDFIEEHSSVNQVRNRSPDETAASVSLQECFGLYTKAETLGQGDAWFCSSCNRKQEVVKRMGLWSVPDVLVVHLKRFRQSTAGSSCNKLSTLVDFPLENFDMSPNVSNRTDACAANGANATPDNAANGATNGSASNGASSNHESVLKLWSKPVVEALSPWRHPSRNNRVTSQVTQPPVGGEDSKGFYDYDLYAVCNHHGTDLQGGHYTATCRNPTDGHWYSFDDMQVTRVTSPRDVITDEAYILFYQRSNLSVNNSASNSSNSSSSSSSSSSTSSSQEHWVYRMPDFSFKAKNGAATTTASTAKAVPKAATTATKPAAATTASVAASNKEAAVPAAEKSTAVVVAGKDCGDGGTNSSFTRNSGKYATLPAKKSSSDVIKYDGLDRFSDGEFSDAALSDSDDDDEEVDGGQPVASSVSTAPTSSVDKEKLASVAASSNAAAVMAPAVNGVRKSVILEEPEDVRRPIDQNDVD